MRGELREKFELEGHNCNEERHGWEHDETLGEPMHNALLKLGDKVKRVQVKAHRMEADAGGPSVQVGVPLKIEDTLSDPTNRTR